MSEKENTYCKCLYFSANALARNITKMAEEAFAAVDLAPSYAFIVMTINKEPGICAGELAKKMMLTPSTITRLLEKLEQKGLAKRHSEGKSSLIYPTKSSVEMNEKIKEAWYKLYEEYTGILGEKFAHDMTGDIFKAALMLNK